METIELIKPITDTIPQFFAGKNVLITGFTGFLGKYHVAKLLTDCPKVGKIYVLVRNSSKKTAQQRFDETLENRIFRNLKTTKPEQLKKIILIEGDMSIPDLGISEKNRKLLINDVSIIYHIAAPVQFDLHLKDSVLINVRGTRDLCRLVLQMKKVSAFAHISTAYSQIHSRTVEEKLYPAPMNWKEMIEIAETLDRLTVSVLCRKIINEHPNTYTFTKALAEECVTDLLQKKIPCLIFRPTIVVGSTQGLYPGWVDNYNGPVGLIVAQSKGVVRILHSKPGSMYDFVPIDYTINSLIKATWIQQYLRNDSVAVYNCSSYGQAEYNMEKLIEVGESALDNITLNPIWHYESKITSSMLIYYLHTFFFHVLPGVFIDMFLKFYGNKPMFVRLQRKVYIATLAVSYFLENRWDFLNYKCEALDEHMKLSDKEAFESSCSVDGREIMIKSAEYIKKYMMKEKEQSMEEIKRKRLIFTIIHYTLKYTSIFILSTWFVDAAVLPFMEYYGQYWKRL